MSESGEDQRNDTPITDIHASHEPSTSGDGPRDHATRVEIPHGDPVAALGMQRAGHDGHGMIDALAGRASVFGFGFAPVAEAMQSIADHFLGDASATDPPRADQSSLAEVLREWLGQQSCVVSDSVLLLPSADQAIDHAIGLARQHSDENRFRTIAFVGSDHGRTGMCRTASGKPSLSAGYGPMMAGFAHVSSGDLDAVRSVIDGQTAAVLVSPIDFYDAARPIDDAFLLGLRELCDENGVMLIVDETRIAIGASGKQFSFASLADIRADMVIASAGLFQGAPGGLVIASQRCTGGRGDDTDRYPIQSAIAAATLSAMIDQKLPASTTNDMQQFAVALAEQISAFEFVRDIHVCGMTLGIQTDIDSERLVRAAAAVGLRIEAAGETAVRVQPPLVIRDDDRKALLGRLNQAMESVQLETASLGV